jgi:beta-galactosidase
MLVQIVRAYDAVVSLIASGFHYGAKWAEDRVKTTGKLVRLNVSADRAVIAADGKDLSFVTVRGTDENGLTVPRANNPIRFSIEGPGEIVSTDNGDPTNFTPFPSHEREAFNGQVLVIVRSKPREPGSITVTAKSPGLKEAQGVVKIQ